MATAKFDVLTIGNAIVDIIAHGDDDFLVREDINKGAMNLIDAERAEYLYAAMGSALEASGGSAGNTAAGVASFGGKTAYFGKVSNDHLGGVFTHDIRAIGVAFDSKPLEGEPPTARSMIFVTPDGERTMNTYLGACVELDSEDIDADVVGDSQVTYFEGYLWDPPRAKDAIRQAASIAHAHDREVAMTLSDPFCVDRYRDEFLDLMRSGTVDITFANDSELKSLYQTADLPTAFEAVKADCKLTIVTRGEDGCVVVTPDAVMEVAATPVDTVVDTTGAGDLFAAGFLYAYTQGYELEQCAKIGGLAAAEVISHIGPRPQTSLSDLLAQSGLLSAGQ
ncbi:MAG: adenosine kinase [Pseudomonadota bacterium]